MRQVRRTAHTAARWSHKHFQTLAGVTLVAGLGLALLGQREAIAAFDFRSDPGALLGGLALLAIAPLLQSVTFGLALRRLGATPQRSAVARIWARSFLLRYEPSGAVGFVYRVHERERLGATTPQVLTASGYEQLAVVVAGALAAVGGFLIAGMSPPWTASVLLGGTLAVVLALQPRALGDRIVRRLAARGTTVAGPLRGRTLAGLVALDLVGWMATAGGLVLVAQAVVGPAAPGAGVLLGAFALSWLTGVLVPMLPGGLGVRDATLVVALTGPMGVGAATGLALALRLVSFAAELLAVAVAEGGAFARARRGALAARTRAALPATVPGVGDGAPFRAGRSIVVVPTYEERETLPLLVQRLRGSGFDLLVVDDGSPDGTGALAEELAAERGWMHVMHRPSKDGLGMAYRAGFAWCLDRGYDVIGQMDCDLSHPPEALAEMRAALQTRGADLVPGSRYAPGGGTEGWSRSRLALSRAGCRASRAALGLPYSDLSGGFKLWRARTLRAVGLDDLLSTGYAFQVETTQVAHLLGARVEEVPFLFSERVAGASKMTPQIAVEGVKVTLALRRRARRRVPLAGV